MNLLNLLMFLLIAALGGYLGYVSKLPVGVILGAMFAVGLSKYVGVLAFEPSSWLSLTNQIMLGIMLGVSFIKIDGTEIKKLRWGLVIIFLGVILMTFLTGWAIAYLSPLDIQTAIISSAPGAIAEMSILANALELNTPIIVLLHLVRVISVVFIFSLILRYVHTCLVRKKCTKREVL